MLEKVKQQGTVRSRILEENRVAGGVGKGRGPTPTPAPPPSPAPVWSGALLKHSGVPKPSLRFAFLMALDTLFLESIQNIFSCKVNSTHQFSFRSSATLSRKLIVSISQEQKSPFFPIPPHIWSLPFATPGSESLEGGDQLLSRWRRQSLGEVHRLTDPGPYCQWGSPDSHMWERSMLSHLWIEFYKIRTLIN